MRILYSILVLLFFNLSFSQKFEKGYFIENNGNKVECFLDKKYQHYSPDIIKYKLSEKDNIKEIDVNSIKELRIYDKVIYYKFNVDMNSSSTRISELDYEKKLRTIKKNILLEIIEKGKINLYLYRDIEGKSSFYYLKDDDSNPELLDYKKYKSGESIIVVSENNDFRNEIYNLVKESNISIEEVENLKYEDRDLIKIIKKYNQINNNSVEIDKRSITGGDLSKFSRLKSIKTIKTKNSKEMFTEDRFLKPGGVQTMKTEDAYKAQFLSPSKAISISSQMKRCK